LIAGVPTLGLEWDNFRQLIEYRHGLLHARASRPQTSGMAADSLPMPPLGTLLEMAPGWPTGVVARLIIELVRAANKPIPSWLKEFDTDPAGPGVGEPPHTDAPAA